MALDIRILIVDDFEQLRDNLRNGLESLGFNRIDEGINGEEGLRLLREAKAANMPFDIVFSDWNMPVMTGIQFLEAVRADEAFKNLPFVLVTSETDANSVEEALRKGVTEFIPKPYTPQMLSSKLTRIFSKIKKSG